MTSITIIWDKEDISDECLKNWTEYMIEKKMITGSVVNKILINNKEFMNRDEIIKHRKWYDKLNPRKSPVTLTKDD